MGVTGLSTAIGVGLIAAGTIAGAFVLTGAALLLIAGLITLIVGLVIRGKAPPECPTG